MPSNKSPREAIEIVNVTLSNMNTFYEHASQVESVATIPAECKMDSYDTESECNVVLDHIERIRTTVDDRHGTMKSDLPGMKSHMADRLVNQELETRLTELESIVEAKKQEL